MSLIATCAGRIRPACMSSSRHVARWWLNWLWLLLLVQCGLAVAHPTIQDLQSLRESDPGGLLQRLDRELSRPDPNGDARYLAYQFRLRAEMLLQRGDFVRARADADAFMQRARFLGEDLLLSRALTLQATLEAAQGNLDRALERLDAARQSLGSTNESAELARTHLATAAVHEARGNHAAALVHYEQALELARSVDERPLVALALAGQALATRIVKGPEAGLVLHESALALARGRGDLASATLQLAAICEAQVQAGQLEGARSSCRQAMNEAERFGMEEVKADVQLALGDLSRQRGDLGTAVRHYNAAMAKSTRATDGNARLLARFAQVHDHYGGSELPSGASIPNASALRVRELEQTLLVEREQHRLALSRLNGEMERSSQSQQVLLTLAFALVVLLGGLALLSVRRGYRAKATLQRRLASRDEVLEQARLQIDELAPTDALTGLIHRRRFELLANREIKRANRSGQALTLAIVNIEDFTTMSAQFGQQAGEEMLREVARQLQANLRETDLVCRWRDAEFLCVLPDNDIGGAERTMQRMRQRLAGQPLLVWGDALPITLSFGIAHLGQEIEAAVRAAEAALRATPDLSLAGLGAVGPAAELADDDAAHLATPRPASVALVGTQPA